MASSPYDGPTIIAITEAIALAADEGADPVAFVGQDCWNYHASWQHMLNRDGPAKMWWNLKHDHPAIARALRIDRTQPGACYALAPFRYIKMGNRHLILAAHPCPHTFAPVDMDWLGIETVIAWEPVTGVVTVLTDDRPQLVGQITSETPTVYAEARDFFTAWMRNRAWYAEARRMNRNSWSVPPAEHDMLPGALIVGEAEDIRWPCATMPRNFQAVGIDPKRLNRAILKSARLPMCDASPAIGTNIARAA